MLVETMTSTQLIYDGYNARNNRNKLSHLREQHDYETVITYLWRVTSHFRRNISSIFVTVLDLVKMTTRS